MNTSGLEPAEQSGIAPSHQRAVHAVGAHSPTAEPAGWPDVQTLERIANEMFNALPGTPPTGAGWTAPPMSDPAAVAG